MLATLLAAGVLDADVTPPDPDTGLEPLTLAEVKLNLRLNTDSTDEDALITALIVAARQHVENATGLVLVARTVTETAPKLGRWIDLAAWPVTSVAAIRYPVAGVMTGLGSAAWFVSTKRRPVRVVPAAIGWGLPCPPAPMASLPIEIDVAAGYATPGDVPQAVKQAMHLLVAHWHGNRAASEVGARAAAVEIPFGVDELLRPYKLMRV